ncbi:hypothetical protein [Comamonas sp. GB3 AK4-5]
MKFQCPGKALMREIEGEWGGAESVLRMQCTQFALSERGPRGAQ